MVILAGYCPFTGCYFEPWIYNFLYSLFGTCTFKKRELQCIVSAFCFANVLENTTVNLSWQQFEKKLCEVLEIYGGTEQLRKKLFPQRRVHELIFKYETLTGRKLSLEEWRKLFKRLRVEQEFLDIVQNFTIGNSPSNIKTSKVWEVCKTIIITRITISYIFIITIIIIIIL